MQFLKLRFHHRLKLARSTSVVVLACISLSAVATEGRNATKSEAELIMADSTIDFSHDEHHFYEYYAIDGVARGGDGSGSRNIQGHWRVRPDGTVCFLHDDLNQSGCVFIQVTGESIEFHRIDGVVEGPFKLERGNPHRL